MFLAIDGMGRDMSSGMGYVIREGICHQGRDMSSGKGYVIREGICHQGWDALPKVAWYSISMSSDIFFVIWS